MTQPDSSFLGQKPKNFGIQDTRKACCKRNIQIYSVVPKYQLRKTSFTFV